MISWEPVLPVLFLLVLIPGLMALLSRLGGWKALAERYPCSGEAPRPRYWFGYGIFGRWCGYNGCLIVSADQAGCYLSLWRVFSFCHPPIFIPWSELREIRKQTICWKPIYRFVTTRAPEVDFALRGRTFEFIRLQAEACQVRIVGEQDKA